MHDRPDIVIFDSRPEGHRANYVRIMARLTGGRPLIAPVRRSLATLLFSRSLLLTTFETEPTSFLPILILRSLMRRRTAVLFLRAHLHQHRRPLNRLLHRFVIGLVGHLRSILPLTPVPLPPGTGGDRFALIQDPEFWDLDPADLDTPDTPLSEQVRAFAEGRPILLFTGYIERARGIEFMRDIYERGSGLSERLAPVLCGMIDRDAAEAAAALERSGALVVDRYLSHEEMMSLYRAADVAWCCYVPERDLSSGIFGRALQFGVVPIVRRGSVLDSLAAGSDNAVRLDFGHVADAVGALETLETGVARSPRGSARANEQRNRVQSLLLDHFQARAGAGN